jgi:hypothetical protein
MHDWPTVGQRTLSQRSNYNEAITGHVTYDEKLFYSNRSQIRSQ